MKKLSLLLALLLALSVCLVACGEKTEEPADDSSVETPSETPSEDASEDASTDASEDASTDASEDASTDASEDASTDVPAEITGSNIAPQATYTTSELFRQDENWNYNENSPVAYPDEENCTMTDGVYATSTELSDPAWIGFNGLTPDYATNGYSSITFDLGAATDITGVKAYVGTEDLSSGIKAPDSVSVFVSSDNATWTELGTAIPLNVASEFATECVEIAGAANAQYVQIRFVGAGWTFVSEIEIYA